MDQGRLRCNALRGLAIVSILCHNFVHHYPGMLVENDEMFVPQYARDMLNTLLHPAADLLTQLVSFFGHYGVPIFIFLSGYGLVKSYEGPHSRHVGQSAKAFIWQHYKKLLWLLLPALIAAAILHNVDIWMVRRFTWQRAILQSLFITNIFHFEVHIFIYVPWWFLGMLFQLYIIYRLALRATPTSSNWHRYGLPLALGFLSWLCISLMRSDYWMQQWQHHNAIDHFIPFGLGLITARYEAQRLLSGSTASLGNRLAIWLFGIDPRITGGSSVGNCCRYGLLTLIGAATVVVFCLNRFTWPLVSIPVLITAISFVRLFGTLPLRPVAWLGTLAAPLYITHPLVREITLNTMGSMTGALALFWAIAIAIAIPYKYCYLQRMPSASTGKPDKNCANEKKTVNL